MNTENDDEREQVLEDDGVHTRFSSADSPSQETIQAIAALKGVKPTAIEPLYDTIDSEALDALFADSGAFDDNPIVATFTVSDCRVIIQSDGTLSVKETTESE